MLGIRVKVLEWYRRCVTAQPYHLTRWYCVPIIILLCFCACVQLCAKALATQTCKVTATWASSTVFNYGQLMYTPATLSLLPKKLAFSSPSLRWYVCLCACILVLFLFLYPSLYCFVCLVSFLILFVCLFPCIVCVLVSLYCLCACILCIVCVLVSLYCLCACILLCIVCVLVSFLVLFCMPWFLVWHGWPGTGN